MTGWAQRLGPLPSVALPDGLTVHVARSAAARRRGLGGLDDLPADRALHLPRTRAVHTLTMRFALDLVWLDRRGAAVRVDRGVPPRRHRACLRARSVVEARAGAADALLGADLVALVQR